MSFTLKLLGGVSMDGVAGPVTGPAAQRHRLALMALLAVSRPPSVGREKLMASLWPEHDTERARALLNQAVHALRRTLGAEAILTAGDDLRLDPAVVRCDVSAFEEALAADDPGRAAALYTGPFLDGFFLDEAPEFQRWVDRERERLEALHAKALEALAETAERSGDWTNAVAWWRARAANDPLDSRVALRLMTALECEGNPAGALRLGLAHQLRLREDLGIEPSAQVAEAVARLRQASAAIPSAVPAPSPAAPPGTPSLPDSPPPAAPLAARWPVRVAAAAVVVVLAAAALQLMPRRTASTAGSASRVDEIAEAVARELDRRGRGDTAELRPAQRTSSIPAYELYLRGSDPALLRSDSAARRGLEYFERALALDSNYAAAWAGLARMRYRVSQSAGIALRPGVRDEGEAAARKAVTLDPDLAEGHAILGMFRAMARDLPAAQAHLQRAVSLEPSRAVFREWLSNFYLLTGQMLAALEEAERAAALDPLSPSAHAEVARALIAMNRCDEAMVHLEKVTAVDPPLLRAAPLLAQCQGRKGKWAEAIGVLKPQADRGDPLAMAFLGYMYARAGMRNQAAEVQAMLEARAAEGAYYLAFIPAALGDRDGALKWLDRGLADGSFGFTTGRSVPFLDPPFDDLKGDPRLDQLRARFLTPP